MRQRLDAVLVAHPREQLPELRIARDLVGQVADEVRQLVAGVGALEVRRAVDVVVGVDQPVRVEHDDRVDAELAAAAADLPVPVDRVLPRAFARAVELAQVHRRHVGDLGGECELAHVSGSLTLPANSPAACLLIRAAALGPLATLNDRYEVTRDERRALRHGRELCGPGAQPAAPRPEGRGALRCSPELGGCDPAAAPLHAAQPHGFSPVWRLCARRPRPGLQARPAREARKSAQALLLVHTRPLLVLRCSSPQFAPGRPQPTTAASRGAPSAAPALGAAPVRCCATGGTRQRAMSGAARSAALGSARAARIQN